MSHSLAVLTSVHGCMSTTQLHGKRVVTPDAVSCLVPPVHSGPQEVAELGLYGYVGEAGYGILEQRCVRQGPAAGFPQQGWVQALPGQWVVRCAIPLHLMLCLHASMP